LYGTSKLLRMLQIRTSFGALDDDVMLVLEHTTVV